MDLALHWPEGASERKLFVLRWPEVQIRSRRRRHLCCFQAVGEFPGSFPANDKLIR